MLKKFWIIKVGLIFIILTALAVVGIVLHDSMTAPKEEGVAHLIPETIKPYSSLTDDSSSFAGGVKIKPDELIDLPVQISDSSKNVHYFSVPIGKNNVFVITQKDASGQVKAWIDTNFDQCLSDEKALSGIVKKRSGDRNYAGEYFDFGKNQISGKNFTSVPFYFFCDKRGRWVEIQPVDCMKGKIRLGKRTYRVAVVDGDYDGKFSTLYQPSDLNAYWGCDTFVADSNRYGLSGGRNYDPGKVVPLGKYFKFTRERYFPLMSTAKNTNERYYGIDLSADGKTLRMQPVEPAMGTLKIGEGKRLSINLFSDSATQKVDFRDEMKLPAGLYQMYRGGLTFTDKQGEEYQFRPDFRDDIRKGQFVITAGQTVTLNPGPPFALKSEISKQGEGKLGINAGLIGNEGEEYGLRISRSMPNPKLRILDENNKELHSGTMEFG